MGTGVRTKYNIAINSKGFILRGAPKTPHYVKEEAPTLVNQLGVGDISYASLGGSGWSSRAQSDWSGGYQELKWKDNATFKDGQAIDPVKKYGQISLQNNFTSAASISGSHSYGAHAVHGSKLLLGTVKSNYPKIFSVTSAGTLSTISAYTGMSAVNAIEKYKGNTLIGLTRTSGSLKTLARYNGSTLSAFRSTNPIVRAIKEVGIRAYISERVASLSGDVLSYATNLSAFSSGYQAGINKKIPKIEELNGAPYFFVQEENQVYFYRWDESAERAYLIYSWNNLTDWGTAKYISNIIITGTSNGKKVAYAFNGARLLQIFDDQLLDSSYDFSKPFEFQGNLHTKGAQWDGKFWFPGLYAKFATVQYTPFANFANRTYGYATTGTVMKVGYRDTTKYAISGHVIGSEMGHDIGGVDKFINSVNVNCEALATGQTIQVLKSTDGGSSFSGVGTISHANDGAVASKRLYFSSGLVTKLWNYKIQLVGPGTSTPTVKDIAFEYRPLPDLKKRWNLRIDAGDNIGLLNNQKEQRDGKNLMSELWMEKEAKRTVVYEDVDAFEVNLVSAMAKANTSARVDSVAWMPSKGRARVVVSGIAEEMTYTSADGGVIKGISRGQKGTKARAYTTAHNIDNFYTVFVKNISEEINNTDQDKTESIANVVLLEV